MGAFRSKLIDDHEIGAISAPADRAPRVAVIGGGASGTLLALALARSRPRLKVILIEPAPKRGRGLAYGTQRPEHRLNVLPSRLSAFSDRPDDFAKWLIARGVIASSDEKAFVPRALFGEYLEERLAEIGDRIQILRTEATGVEERSDHVRLGLATGRSVEADAAILATGHSWALPRDIHQDVPSDVPVTMIGTGLSMVDRWLALRESGHRGVITAMSRHGLAPLDHGRCQAATILPSVPLGRSVSQTMRWLRNLSAEAADWRTIVDGVRPHTQAIWQSWSVAERRRFLRDARRHWDVHRHRVAADIGARLAAELAAGTLRVVRSRERPAGLFVFDCRGYMPDWSRISNPLIAGLVGAGLVRSDPLGIGLDVTTDCRLIDRNGRTSERLFAVGPITRGRFWEIEAIPDIRKQCEAVAAQVARNAAGSAIAAHESAG